jgi:hemin uptake protein HemP
MSEGRDPARALGDAPAGDHAARPVRRVPLSRIIGADREVLIDHDGQRYRLRITGKGKLLSTKWRPARRRDFRLRHRVKTG